MTDDAQRTAASQDVPQSAHSPADAAKERRQAIDKEIEGLLQAAPARFSEPKTDAKAENSADDVLLPHNSAGSAKARHGGTIYDMLIQ